MRRYNRCHAPRWGCAITQMKLSTRVYQILLTLHLFICISFASRLSINEETEDEIPIEPFDMAVPQLGDKLYRPDQIPEAMEYLKLFPKIKITDYFKPGNYFQVGKSGLVRKLDDYKGNTFALKTILVKELDAVKTANEIIVMKGIIKSPYLIKAHNVFQLEDSYKGITIGIVMDYVRGKNLEDYFSDLYRDSFRNPNTFSEGLAAKLSHDVLTGLQTLHIQGVVHANINLKNIIYDAENGNFVVINYGMSAGVNTIHVIKDFADYPLPESLESDNYYVRFSPSVDIFSFGVVLFGLLEPHSQLLKAGDSSELIRHVRGENKTSDYRKYSDNLFDFLVSLLETDIRKDDNVASFLDHPFLKETHYVPPPIKNRNELKNRIESSLDRDLSRFSDFGATRV